MEMASKKKNVQHRNTTYIIYVSLKQYLYQCCSNYFVFILFGLIYTLCRSSVLLRKIRLPRYAKCLDWLNGKDGVRACFWWEWIWPWTWQQHRVYLGLIESTQVTLKVIPGPPYFAEQYCCLKTVGCSGALVGQHYSKFINRMLQTCVIWVVLDRKIFILQL